jgi:hypothetical protein
MAKMCRDITAHRQVISAKEARRAGHPFRTDVAVEHAGAADLMPEKHNSEI